MQGNTEQTFDRCCRLYADRRFFCDEGFYLSGQSCLKEEIDPCENIDCDNVIYWKLYAQINQRLKFYEEAERGYKKTLELGNYELNTWLDRGDLLIKLGELEAAETLEDMRYMPAARCREKKGDRKGQLSVDLQHPYRLIFTPDHDPPPVKSGGGLDWSEVTRVVILEIVDYH